MSQLVSYTLIGDSNIRRALSTSSNTRGRPLWSSAQFIPCGRLSTLSSSLTSVRPESDACVVACLTNFLTGSISTTASSSGSISSRIDPLMTSFVEKVFSFSKSRPSLTVFICPPMYRLVPIWYRESLPEIMQKFSKMLGEERPSNVLVVPSFAKFDLEADGIHLTPYSGMEYLIHLFDDTQELRNKSMLPDVAKVAKIDLEAIGLANRVVVLEQDHARLNRRFERQSAETSELLDLDENLRNEIFLMVQGLPQLPKLETKEWQSRARADVDKIFSEMGLPHVCRYVQNLTGRGKNARTLYKVCLNSVESSRVIRGKFGEYFAGGKDSRPSSLKEISVRNCLTPATLGRIAILQLLGKRYRDSNPGSKFQVISYEPRPVLKLTPPPGVADKRVQSFNFIEAVSKLPTNFTAEEVESLLKRISPKLHGRLQSLFIVLSDDMLKKKTYSKKSAAQPHDGPSESDSPPSTTPEGGARRKRPLRTPEAGPLSKK